MKKNLYQMIFGLSLVILPGYLFAQIRSLNVGDKCPAALINYINNKLPEKSKDSVLDKPVLIDFWATWCAPCVKALPHIDSMVNKYRGQLTILSVKEDSGSPVSEVLKKIFPNQVYSLNILANDSVFRRYFPHQTIPHCVWIDKTGVVKAITGNILDADLLSFLSGNTNKVVMKPKMLKITGKEPLFATGGANAGKTLVYHSMVTQWREDLPTRYARGKTFIDCFNSPIIRLFQIAYGKFDLQWLDMNRVMLVGMKTQADSVVLGLFVNKTLTDLWRHNIQQNAFSYELMIPDSCYTNDQMFEMMQQDLNRYFLKMGISGRFEMMKRKVIALTKIDASKIVTDSTAKYDKHDHFVTANNLKVVNQPVSAFLADLSPYLQDKKLPVMDLTDYKKTVSIELDCDLHDLAAVDNGLRKFGFSLREQEETIPTVVITKVK